MTYRGSLDTTRAGVGRWLWLAMPALLLACSESSGGANGDAATPDADAAPVDAPLKDSTPMDVAPPDVAPPDAPPPDDVAMDAPAADVSPPDDAPADIACAADQQVCTAVGPEGTRRYCAALATDVANCLSLIHI